MGKVQDHPKFASQVKEEYERSLFRLLSKPGEVQAQALEPKTVDGVAYNVAFVKSDLVKGFNEATGYNRRTVFVVDKKGKVGYIDLAYSPRDSVSFGKLRSALKQLQ